MKLIIKNKQAFWGGKIFPCLIGQKGLAVDKVEGDKKTPVGCFGFRQVFYRHDRIGHIQTVLPQQKIEMDMGWCDDPLHPDYNRFIRRPFSASHEMLAREDCLYDIILVIGHNDEPVIPGKGSAVFVHLIAPESTFTAGCVALERDALLHILSTCTLDSSLLIHPE